MQEPGLSFQCVCTGDGTQRRRIGSKSLSPWSHLTGPRMAAAFQVNLNTSSTPQETEPPPLRSRCQSASCHPPHCLNLLHVGPGEVPVASHQQSAHWSCHLLGSKGLFAVTPSLPSAVEEGLRMPPGSLLWGPCLQF